MAKDIFSMSPEDWKIVVRFLTKKDGIEVYLLTGETVADLKQRIMGVVAYSFLRSLQVEIREEDGRYFVWLV